jgi:hypothetical protein
MLFHGIDEEQPKPVTLPRVAWIDKAPIESTKDVAARFCEKRILRAGIESWAAIARAETYEGWCKVAAALAIGRQYSLRVTGANAAWGKNYSRVLGDWMKEQGFDRMPKGIRSWALALNEHLPAIEVWRKGLSNRERQRLINPQSIVRRWQRATAQKTKPDAVSKAEAAWKNFVGCVEALPPDQAAPFWQAAQAHAAAVCNVS